MIITSTDTATIHKVAVKEDSLRKIEISIDKLTGEISLYYMYREDMLTTTWHGEPLYMCILTKGMKGVEDE